MLILTLSKPKTNRRAGPARPALVFKRTLHVDAGTTRVQSPKHRQGFALGEKLAWRNDPFDSG